MGLILSRHMVFCHVISGDYASTPECSGVGRATAVTEAWHFQGPYCIQLGFPTFHGPLCRHPVSQLTVACWRGNFHSKRNTHARYDVTKPIWRDKTHMTWQNTIWRDKIPYDVTKYYMTWQNTIWRYVTSYGNWINYHMTLRNVIWVLSRHMVFFHVIWVYSNVIWSLTL